MSRLVALLNTTRRIAQYEGAGAVIRHLVRWLGGERGYHRLLEPDTPTYADFKRRTVPTRRQLRAQAREMAQWGAEVPSILIWKLPDTAENDPQVLPVVGTDYSAFTTQDKASGRGGARPYRDNHDSAITGGIQTPASQNGGILSAKWVGFLEAGDSLTPDAVYHLLCAMRENPDADVIYSDYEAVDAVGANNGANAAPCLKPDWSPEMMLSVNLLARFALFRRGLLDDLPDEMPPETIRSASDLWALTLAVSRRAKRIVHVPRILCRHVRRTTDVPTEADATILTRHLTALGVDQPVVRVAVEPGGIAHPVCAWAFKRERLVSVIIPTRDHPDVLKVCIESIFAQTTSSHYEIILLDTGSTDPAVEALYADWTARGGIRVVRDGTAFNFSRVCNLGAQEAQGDLLLFLNNDTEVLPVEAGASAGDSPPGDWLQRLTQWFELDGVGMVGAKLLYPDGMIQHAGVRVGVHGLADNWMARLPEHSATLFGSDDDYRNLLAVTAACALVSREAFKRVGGFDERYQLNFSDVQLGVDLHEAGYRIVYTPDVRLIHHESLTHRGRIPDDDIALGKRLLAKWIARGDPYGHPALSRTTPRPRLQ